MSLLQRLNPSIVQTSLRERTRACVGALLGISATGLASTLALGTDHAALPLLIAPMGASAVLLFAAPTSPLAQPWSIIGGNLVASCIGVACAHYIDPPLIAAGLAVALAIAGMLMANCLHPPSGAVALTAVLGGPAVQDAGYWFVLSPVALNSVLLLLIALIFNNATGRAYPHMNRPARNPAHRTADPLPSARAAAGASDIAAAVKEYDEVVPVSPDELEHLLQRAQTRAFARLSRDLACADIMSRDVISVRADASLARAWRVMARHRLDTAPVVDAAGQLVGIVSLADFVNRMSINHKGRSGFGWRARMRAIVRRQRGPKSVSDIMLRKFQSVLADTSIACLLSPMADQGVHLMPVVDAQNRILGIITQSDLIAALFHTELRNRSATA